MADYPALPLWTDALVADTDHLSDAEFGAYLRMLIVSWRSSGCDVPNDTDWIQRRFREAATEWPRYERLIDEFFTKRGTRLIQKRLKREREFVENSRQKQSARAKSRWHKDNDECRGNAALHVSGNAPTPTPFFTLESPTNSESKSLTTELEGGTGGTSEPGPSMPSPQAAPARSSPNRKANGHHQPERATRLSPDWRPGDDGIAYAMGELGNDTALVNETWTSFRDFWLAKAGPGARKVSWPLTWKTWVRRTRDDLRERHARLERLQPKAARH